MTVARHLFIDGHWCAGAGEAWSSRDPGAADIVWSGQSASPRQLDDAVAAARLAWDYWRDEPLEQRTAALLRFAGQLKIRRALLVEAICREVGKPRWDAEAEVAAMIAKVDASIEAYHARRAETARRLTDAAGVTRYRPHGVVAVLGPFNFPGHVPNGHIVPALLAGNTVIFKPSERAPLVAQRTVECWDAAQLPPGVLNLVQGGRTIGEAIAHHPRIDGIFFTGGAGAGVALQRAFVEHPGKILALELGGNNPLVVHRPHNIDAAVYHAIQSAYVTAGQRCTCARRLIVTTDWQHDAFIARLIDVTRRLRVGHYTARPEPFSGPVISDDAAATVLQAQQQLTAAGAEPLLLCRALEPQAMLAPGLLDVTPVAHRPDREIFGPLLQLIRVRDLDQAIEEANRTSFGLAASLLGGDRAVFEQFFHRVRCGLINWNRPTTGASSLLPFGGVGHSGNHRPTGYFAADYCSYPVACLEAETLALPAQLSPGVEL